MSVQKQKEPSGAAGLRERIAEVVAEHSQSEVARRTGVAVSNVNRYMRSVRVPADFCADMARAFSLSPAWLLMGEGAARSTDLTAGDLRMAGDLLELVEAMAAVERMRLGSLAGRDHLKLLRSLSDALRDYESLKGRLNDQSRDIFQRVLRDWRTALNSNDTKTADHLRKAARQVARLCEDPALQRELTVLEAMQEMLFGDADSGLVYQRRALLSAMAKEDFPSEQDFEQAFRYCVGLRMAGRFDDALRYTRAFLILGATAGHTLRSYTVLESFEGFLLNDLGELEAGLARLQSTLHRLDGRPRDAAECGVMISLFQSGLAEYDSLALFGSDSPGRASTLLEFAVWLEDDECLHHAADDYDGTDTGNLLLAKALLAARAGRKPLRGIQAEFERHGRLGVFECTALAQVAWHEGNAAASRKWVLEADKQVQGSPTGTRPGLLNLAHHYRNALRLAGKDKALRGVQGRAREFFELYVAKGCRRWASALEAYSSSTSSPRL